MHLAECKERERGFKKLTVTQMPSASFQAERNEHALRFRTALEAISPRGARALRLRFVADTSRQECAAFFGIAPAAFDIMLLRGARELAAELQSGPPHPAPPDDAEQEEAQRLADSLDQHGELSGELKELGLMLEQLASLSTEIRAQDLQALLEERSWTGGRRRELLWRALLLAIVGIALFFYFRPRPAPHVLRRVPPEQLR